MGPVTRRLLAGVAGLLILAPAAVAQDLPPDIRKVFNDYGADGLISPCKHTVGELERTKAAIPPDIDQYAPDFPPLVDLALEAHARGECAGKKPQPVTNEPLVPVRPRTPAATPKPGRTPVPTKTVVSEPPETGAAVVPSSTPPGPPRADAQVRKVSDARPANDTPAPVWMLGLGAGLLALALIAVLVAGRTRRGEAAFEHFRHAWGEAAWRTSGTWVDFTDWVRAGR
jgi:hypothetical protein